jgi:mRNA interferase HigB
MRVVKPKTVREYAEQFPDAHDQLMLWLKVTRAADWNNIVEVRKAYPHADAVKVASGHIVTVFNLRGNRYRLIVAIKYEWSMVYVLRFLTHADYGKNKWKDQL